ncbi:UNVERIFIED_ORG: hypothetical protein ABID33_000522 [Xanthobacter viscosus]|uniref:Uncharacterized protein n=1 Tax=Xanthobacter autotrophicus TaxID=280 RepID=A0A6C1KIH6_XANAU|nr:hypothetical protein [Xanthobacter autotrophicus]TLX43611.1 hypothetical protein FBQ73_05700 [Xanthobacter autotrophicus]
MNLRLRPAKLGDGLQAEMRPKVSLFIDDFYGAPIRHGNDFRDFALALPAHPKRNTFGEAREQLPSSKVSAASNERFRGSNLATHQTSGILCMRQEADAHGADEAGRDTSPPARSMFSRCGFSHGCKHPVAGFYPNQSSVQGPPFGAP